MRACCLTGRGPGGVKIVTTDTTGKIGTTGCPFMGRGGTRLANDAAFLEQRVYTLFGRLVAPTFLTLKSWPPFPVPAVAKALGVDSGKRHVERHHAHRARPASPIMAAGVWPAMVHSPCGPATAATGLWPPEGSFSILGFW